MYSIFYLKYCIIIFWDCAVVSPNAYTSVVDSAVVHKAVLFGTNILWKTAAASPVCNRYLLSSAAGEVKNTLGIATGRRMCPLLICNEHRTICPGMDLYVLRKIANAGKWINLPPRLYKVTEESVNEYYKMTECFM